MVWTDVRFKMLTQFAINDENSALLGRTRLDDEMRAGRSAREREPLWFDHERSELLSLLLTASKAGCRRSEGEAPKAARNPRLNVLISSKPHRKAMSMIFLSRCNGVVSIRRALSIRCSLI